MLQRVMAVLGVVVVGLVLAAPAGAQERHSVEFSAGTTPLERISGEPFDLSATYSFRVHRLFSVGGGVTADYLPRLFDSEDPRGGMSGFGPTARFKYHATGAIAVTADITHDLSSDEVGLDRDLLTKFGVSVDIPGPFDISYHLAVANITADGFKAVRDSFVPAAKAIFSEEGLMRRSSFNLTYKFVF